MVDASTFPPRTSALSDYALVERPRASEVAAHIVEEIRAAVPEYADIPGQLSHHLLSAAAQAAAGHFLDIAQERPARARKVNNLARRLGHAKASQGHTREAVQQAFRVAARGAWEHVADFAASRELPSSDLKSLADALFDYLDHLHEQLLVGYDNGQGDTPADPEEARGRLLNLFLADQPPPPEPGLPLGIDDRMLAQLLPMAEWSIDTHVVALVISYYSNPPVIPDRPEFLTHHAPKRMLVLGPPEEIDALIESVQRSSPGIRLARSWVTPTAEAGSALRWCERALDLVHLGVIPPVPMIFCEDYATQLWLHAEPSMRQRLCQELLEPLLAETPNSRTILSETLLTWVETRDSAPAIAARLDVHPQTVRYRWKRINELFGEVLQDPDFVVQLTLVLKASVPMWKAGNQSDFELFQARKDATP